MAGNGLVHWDLMAKRRDELLEVLISPALDREKRTAFQKELSHLQEVLQHHAALAGIERELTHTQQQAAENTDADMAQLYEQEIADLQARSVHEKKELEKALVPPSDRDDRSVFLEVRAGTGGQEAALFAADLLKMYTNYGLKKGWRVNVENMSYTDLGGFREAVLYIKGKGVYGYLKRESGVHRVQRVPKTETSGRVHTSTATVAVLPEAEDVDVVINPADLRIDVYRSGGAGGQHVNTTDSAVRITHIPTGVVVACQEERSQHKNKAKAMKILQARILAAQEEAQELEMSKQRKELVGGGMRAEKVRTYNFPQNRVTDHQIDLTLNKLDRVIEGDLDEIVEAIYAREHEVRKQEFLDRYK